MESINDNEFLNNENYQKQVQDYIKKQYAYLDNLVWDHLKNELIDFFKRNQSSFKKNGLDSIDLEFKIENPDESDFIQDLSFKWQENQSLYQTDKNSEQLSKLSNHQYNKKEAMEIDIGMDLEDCGTKALQNFNSNFQSKRATTQHKLSISVDHYKSTIKHYFDQWLDVEYKANKEKNSISKEIEIGQTDYKKNKPFL